MNKFKASAGSSSALVLGAMVGRGRHLNLAWSILDELVLEILCLEEDSSRLTAFYNFSGITESK